MLCWEVVGGADKGGILVRAGVDLKSAQLSDRLSKGSLLAQVEIHGERLHYKLVRGAGPNEGWVSLKVSGKDILKRCSDAASISAVTHTVDLDALRKRGDSDSSKYIQGGNGQELPEWDGLTPPPQRGKFVPEPTGRPQAGKEWTPKLRVLPRKLRAVLPFDELLRAKPMPEFGDNMDKLGDDGPIGYWHGLRFPYTLDMIKRYGPEFLTAALHAAGTLPKDNAIINMEVEPFVAGSMSLKCFLHVEYAKQDDDLHTDLFVKYPFPASNGHERKSVYIMRFLMNNDGPEMDFARVLSSGGPMKCPKYYFGDICVKTGLALLITEKLPLPGQSDDFGPYELEAIPYKSVDYLLDKPFDYYDAMTRNIAKLAAWGKCGKLGKDIEDVFPPPSQPAAYFMSTTSRLNEGFLPALYLYAVCLVPEEITGKHGSIRDDEWFVATMRKVLPEVEKCQRQILEYLFKDPDYCGFTHQNMNTDNAMFWRDDAGKVCSGFIDWGRFKRDNFARGFSGGYMCSDLCELVQQSDAQWLMGFIETLASEGGPRLQFETVWEHYMLSWLLQGLAAVDLPRQLALTGSTWCLPEGWKQIPSYKDPRIFRLPNYNNGMCAIIRNFAYYWKCRDLPLFWETWKTAHADILPKGL